MDCSRFLKSVCREYVGEDVGLELGCELGCELGYGSGRAVRCAPTESGVRVGVLEGCDQGARVGF